MKNRGIEGYLSASLQMPIPDVFAEAASTLGLPSHASLGEFSDHFRVHSRWVSPKRLKNFIESFPGWEIEIKEGGILRHGDRAGSIKVAGKKTAVFVHMGQTQMFDRTDPPLEQLFQTAAKGRKTAIVLHALPRFHVDADAEGRIRKILFQGGWHFLNGVWKPFVLSPAGPDDIIEQKNVLKPGAPSRGLLRQRGCDAELLNAAKDFHFSMTTLLGDGEKIPKAEQNRIGLGTNPDGWSIFMSDEARDMQEELLKSLNLAQPEVLQEWDDKGRDDYFDAPEGIVEVVRSLSEDEESAEFLLGHLAHLTHGFDGLTDEVCDGVTQGEIASLVRCSTSRILVSEVAGILQNFFGWDIEFANIDYGVGEDGDDELLLSHGGLIVGINVESFEEPVPVIFHGGWVDPLEAQEDFSLLASRLAVMSGFEGKPVLVMPASVNMRAGAGQPKIPDGSSPDKMIIMAGYAFDGENWTPVSFGEYGSDPFKNTLTEDGFLPVESAGYTKSVSVEGCGDMAPLRAAISLQTSMDQFHDLGPEKEPLRRIQPSKDYMIQLWDDDWLFFKDQKQSEVYGD